MTNDTQYEGVTRGRCADGCGPTGCVISQKPYCAHPHKGGLQARDMHSRSALDRLDAAREFLSRTDLEAGIAKRRHG